MGYFTEPEEVAPIKVAGKAEIRVLNLSPITRKEDGIGESQSQSGRKQASTLRRSPDF